VTAASYLLYLIAALQIIGGIVAISTIDAMRKAYEVAYADFPDLRSNADAIATASAVGGLVIALLFAAGFITLGILDGKGKNPARIVTWVLAGISVCCFGFGALGSAFSNMLSGIGGGNANAPRPGDIQNALQDNLPSWYYPVETTVNILALLSAIAVIVLLALPASNAFFRKPQAVWEPPAYPGVPPTGPPAA
jgi:hypothetical protein